MCHCLERGFQNWDTRVHKLTAIVITVKKYFFQCNCSFIYIYIDRKTRLSMTPVHRTVQEGLSMESFRECITKSKHVF